MADAPPPEGHNLPPAEVETLEDRLRAAHLPMFATYAALDEEAADLPTVVATDEEAVNITELAAKMAKHEKLLDNTRVKEKEPYAQNVLAVDTLFFTPKRSLEARRKDLLERVNTWNNKKAEAARKEAALRAEEQLAAAAESARQAAAAEASARPVAAHQHATAAAAANMAAETSEHHAATARHGVRTESGASTYQTTSREYEVEDWSQVRLELGAFAAYLTKANVEDALKRAAAANPWPVISGVRFFEKTNTHVRSGR